MTDSDPISQCVEALCQCGCDAVRATITAMETGHEVAQTVGLSDQQRQKVLAELRAIMAVYDRT